MDQACGGENHAACISSSFTSGREGTQTSRSPSGAVAALADSQSVCPSTILALNVWIVKTCLIVKTRLASGGAPSAELGGAGTQTS